MTEVSDDVFESIQLNEQETDMAFTQILNKFRSKESGHQPSSPEVQRGRILDKDDPLKEMKFIDEDEEDDDEYTPKSSMTFGLSLDASETSLVDEEINTLSPHEMEDDDFDCTLDDNMETPSPQTDGTMILLNYE